MAYADLYPKAIIMDVEDVEEFFTDLIEYQKGIMEEEGLLSRLRVGEIVKELKSTLEWEFDALLEEVERVDEAVVFVGKNEAYRLKDGREGLRFFVEKLRGERDPREFLLRIVRGWVGRTR